MATLQTNPSSTPNAVQEWTRELNVSEIGRVGKINIVLTNWNETSSALPSVVLGSFIEINNSVYVEGTTVALNTASQTVSAVNWIIYTFSGSTATATLTGTAPTASDYDADKGGFYNGSGYRYTGHYMSVDATGLLYTNKGFLDYADGAMLRYRIDDEASDFVIDADLGVTGNTSIDGNFSLTGNVTSELNLSNDLNPVTTVTTSNHTFVGSGSQTWTVPRGVYDILLYLSVTSTTCDITLSLERYINGAWYVLESINHTIIGTPGSASTYRITDGTHFSTGGATNLRLNLTVVLQPTTWSAIGYFNKY